MCSLNTAVHLLMYAYYFATIYRNDWDRDVLMRYKKLLTRCQLVGSNELFFVNFHKLIRFFLVSVHNTVCTIFVWLANEKL